MSAAARDDHPDPASSEDGSTTVWFAGVIAVLVVIAATFIGAASIFAARAQLQATVNLAALAAADAAPISAVVAASGASSGAPTSGCFVAEQVAQANGATLAECFHQGFDAFVVGTSSVKVAGLPMKVQAKARAGPTLEGIEQLTGQ